MRILKFGGKSLATAEKMQNICQFIKKVYKKDQKLIIVVSAIGNTTDLLLNKSKEFVPHNTFQRELDVLLSCGETISSSLFAMTLNSIGIPAESLQGWQIKINTMGEHQNSLITSIDKRRINECLNNGIVAVISGFQGINKFGDITTLGRGGSDTTASALGATFQTNVELYSDFNGVFCCDPNEQPSKKIQHTTLDRLDYLSQNNAKIISNRAVKIAKEHNISFTLKSSTQPNLKGTSVCSLESNQVSLTTNQNLCEICVYIPEQKKLEFIFKNVLVWLKKYKLYNLTLSCNNIKLLINQSEKSEILKVLSEKLKLTNV